MTYQAIADARGISEKTVRIAVSEFPKTQPQTIIGKDSKHYPTREKPRQPETVIATTKAQEKKVMKSIAEAACFLP